MITPKFDYLLVEEVRDESGVVTTTDVADHWQKYKILATGEGRYQGELFIKQEFTVGQVIYVQKHSEADSPDDLKKINQYLIQASRVMAVEEN